MFGLAFGKIKDFIIAALALLIPIIYVLGRKDQKKINRSEALEDALELEKDRAEFYRAMEKEHNEIENSKPTDRNDLVNRLRSDGL